MNRKKWTPMLVVTKELLAFREKRKWQLALRRYVLERSMSAGYAFYFGLGIEAFREWIELQFIEGLNWENFGSAWQFDHVIPISYFDFSIEDDLLLCWNFINIRVEMIEQNSNKMQRIDIIAAKPYFTALYSKTGYSICSKMINKICKIEDDSIVNEPLIELFIINNKKHIEKASSLNKGEFNSLNKGVTLDDILLQREIIRKFG